MEPMNVARAAHDQILQYIETGFSRHELARLVEAILRADGYVTQRSGPGPDGGVDILASRGSLGFDGPRLCVQVKSGRKPESVNTLRALQGSMRAFDASQGLLVAWAGFTTAVHREARRSFFSLRLWSANDVLDTLYRVYDQMPEEIQADLPLRRVWALIPNSSGRETG